MGGGTLIPESGGNGDSEGKGEIEGITQMALLQNRRTANARKYSLVSMRRTFRTRR